MFPFSPNDTMVGMKAGGAMEKLLTDISKGISGLHQDTVKSFGDLAMTPKALPETHAPSPIGQISDDMIFRSRLKTMDELRRRIT
jgi:hypothetical protein